jgi:hypothetical protein
MCSVRFEVSQQELLIRTCMPAHALVILMLSACSKTKNLTARAIRF